MTHGIYLSAIDDKEGFRLPVNPEKVAVEMQGDGEEFNIEQLGTVNMIKARKLKRFKFSSFFPVRDYPFIVSDKLLAADEYVALLELWLETRQPIRFIYAKGAFDVNVLVSIESFEYDESDASGDINFELTLKEFVPIVMKKVEVKKTNAKVRVTTTDSRMFVARGLNKESLYRFTSEDTLFLIAKKLLGDGTRWTEIQRLNGISDANLRTIKPGTILRIPPRK